MATPASKKGPHNLIAQYVSTVSEKYQTGQAREHAYRPAFEALVQSLDSELKILNDPSRSEHGNPDFVFLRGDITAGYTETKDVGIDLDKTEKSEQMERYFGYSNLILTDYLEFRFFRNGSRYGEPIRIGTITGGKIQPNESSFDELANALSDFLAAAPERIKSGKRLAEIMGGKARRIRDNVRRFLADKSDADTELQRIYESVKKMLVHDLTPEEFADMYAQTLVYGLFVARYHDESKDTFSRAEARDLVPESNPFLREFFNHIAGASFNKRLRYIVDELCAVFACADIRELMEEYFKKNGASQGQDPVIHFYEDFLKEYDAELRKKMGAYYTPLPVVRFIVRAVDYVLKTDFGLADGLADTAKLPDGRHKVQVLDPAVGTGTFISAVIRLIYERLIEQGQKGRWPAYVHHDLLPRIHGFELMMAAYTIAHLKLSIAFKQTGFTIFNKRLGIYLTNSLEQAGPQTDMFSLGFAQSIAEEAKQAAVIKNETPIMVVLGNPPYSGESSNAFYKGHDVYKTEPTGGKLKEKNSKWINDDYVKFIRLAESFVEKNKEGVVSMITAHGYLDNPTFRGMRWHLMQTFDDIYVLDLHGNSNKKEKTPEGGKDENVFEIKQGVAVFIGVKRSGKRASELADVFRADRYGTRAGKFSYLNETELNSNTWKKVAVSSPNYEWVIRDSGIQAKYQEGFSIGNLFQVNNTGIVTKRDFLSIDFNKKELWERVQYFVSHSEEEVRKMLELPADVRDWTFDWAKKDLLDSGPAEEKIVPMIYRPFDQRVIYYTGRSRGFVGWPLPVVSEHLVRGDNFALLSTKQTKDRPGVFVTAHIAGHKSFSAYDITSIFPLYVYAEDGARRSNLKKEIVVDIEKVAGKTTPEDIFDYVYAILHSSIYREKYEEFLKIDFPRVSYPQDKKQFETLVTLGRELREIHLLKSSKINANKIPYPEPGSDMVEKIAYKDDRVYINTTQYFGEVPEVAWNFYIGGYQPAQKWLKDRKGRVLTNEDIEHYQKIIVALVETDRVMKEIDQAFQH